MLPLVVRVIALSVLVGGNGVTRSKRARGRNLLMPPPPTHICCNVLKSEAGGPQWGPGPLAFCHSRHPVATPLYSGLHINRQPGYVPLWSLGSFTRKLRNFCWWKTLLDKQAWGNKNCNPKALRWANEKWGTEFKFCVFSFAFQRLYKNMKYYHRNK
jgi:hypothetical protein